MYVNTFSSVKLINIAYTLPKCQIYTSLPVDDGPSFTQSYLTSESVSKRLRSVDKVDLILSDVRL